MNFEAFYKITYGLYVIGTGNKNQKNGYIANTAFQVTAEPPQIAISCSKNNHSAQMIRDSGLFSVSVLSRDAPTSVMRTFGYESGREVDKFTDETEVIYGSTGVPIITTGCAAWFECKVTMQFDVGSHILFVGEVVGNALMEKTDDPLTYAYYREVKRGFAPKNAPTYIDKSKLEQKQEPKAVEPEGGSGKCLVCGFKYDPAVGDPDGGIAPGTPFEEIPDDWVCPVCGATKDMFEPI